MSNIAEQDVVVLLVVLLMCFFHLCSLVCSPYEQAY